MGEQRFTIQKASGMYLHLPIFDNGVEMADGDVCILLNEQQSTISALKEDNDILKQKLRKNYIANKQYEEMKRLQEENEQLRQTMQKVCELLEEEVDLFSDKATEHDVIAYREMQDFDNKDAYYICTATKKAIQMLKGGIVMSEINLGNIEDVIGFDDYMNKRLSEKQKEIDKLEKENEQLRTQLLQQSNDDGRFQVWEVPPIPKGKRISFTTNNDGDGV